MPVFGCVITNWNVKMVAKGVLIGNILLTKKISKQGELKMIAKNPSMSRGFRFRQTLIASAVASTISMTAIAQDSNPQIVEEVVITGIRASLENALNKKREASSLVEVIMSEDIGKLPDQNLAEVLENITGIQITRTAGVGTGVQIRGTNANRVEINGASTTGSGAGRNGINFEDVNASIIAGVEVTKASEAKTIEGSVGGTVNLLTIRPLDLDDMLLSARIQGEESSLSDESAAPRFSGAYGNRWETADNGTFGFVISGSYTEKDATSFRPRTDRDNLSSVPGETPEEFLGIQFLLQEAENDQYETTNLSTTFEWAPNDNLTVFFDAIINEQERSRESYRVQASGVSRHSNRQLPSEFETVNFGTHSGVNFGEFQAALKGTIEPDLANHNEDPNLRFSSETGARITDSEIFRLGGKWQNDKWTASVEFASTSSDTSSPKLDTTVNFINPNCPLNNLDANGDPTPATSNENCVPFIYDLSGGSLSFGINFDSPFAPTVAQLLDPANVVLDQVEVNRNSQENGEDAFRTDFSYYFDEHGVTSVDVGYRYNESTSSFNAIEDTIGGFGVLEDSPNGLLFEELLVRGPTNYGEQDGRTLAIRNFLLLDPDRSFSDQAGTLAILEGALAEHRLANPGANGQLTADLTPDRNQFYDITEETHAIYAQVNFESGIFRGNIGVRYLETEIDAVAFGPSDINGNRSLQSQKSDYSFILPRFNLVASPTDDLLFRFGFGKDIRRPDFTDLSSGFEFGQNENTAIGFGNPGLAPEEVVSWDLSVEWYFAPAAVVSVGYFNKERTNIITTKLESALLIDDGVGGFLRETDPSCPGGGVYNPSVVPNVLGDPNTLGLCVDFNKPQNDNVSTTQTGIELAFQYDLAEFEDTLGWASGFGIIANYTIQDFSGGSTEDCTGGRGATVLGDVCIDEGLLDFSENAYNFTVFYEKYGLSARMRYTWREAFRTEDFAGGSSTNSTFSFPVVTDDRGQLNASINYDINDNFNVGLEGVNLTEENIEQNCVSANGPLCFVGYPDRTVVFGLSYTY
jgi:TonB-dependent receptor